MSFSIQDLKNSWVLIPGLAMTFCALYFLIANTLFWLASESAIGTVVGMERMAQVGANNTHNQPAQAAIVTFTDELNQKITFAADFGSGSGFYKNGETVAVIYNPDDPQNAKIREFKALYLGPFLLLFMGIVFSILGLIFMPGSAKPKRRFIKNG